MVKKLRDSGSSLRRIRDVGQTLKSVEPDHVAETIGAQAMLTPHKPIGAPLSLFALRQAIATRLQSTGGRPGLTETTRRQKIPLSDEEWGKLEQLASTLAQTGIRTTPGQVASILLHRALAQVDESIPAGELLGGRAVNQEAPPARSE